MKKRMICFLLSAVLLLGAVIGLPFRVQAVSAMTASDDVIALLKVMEGFSKYPYKDYTQYTVGYGTRCPDKDYERYKSEGITEEEAEALLKEHIGIAETCINHFIDKYSLNLNQGQFDALVSFSFNCGTGWLSEVGTFRSAVINGAVGNNFLYAICLWCWAGGRVQEPLIKRRLIEANMYLNGVYSSAVPENYCYVLYNANGGSVDIRVQGYDAASPVAPVALPTYEGMTFNGWYSAKSGGTQITSLDSSANGRTLYAQWSSGSGGETEPPVTTEPPVSGEEQEKSVDVKITGTVVNVRKGAGTSYAVVTTVKKGQTVTITETATASGYTWGKFEKGWISLKYTNYDEVVSGGEIEKPEDQVIATGTVYNAPSSLRIRSAADSSSSIVGYLSNGTRVEIYEKKTAESITWGRINKGWISLDYVLLDSAEEEEPENPPVTEPEEPPVTDPEEPENPTTVMGTVYNAPSSLRIRSKAGTSGTTVGYLKNGDRVEILETAVVSNVTWGRISKGWICMDYVKLDTATGGNEGSSGTTVIDTGTVVNAAGSLRVRSKAGTSGSVVGYLHNGDRVEIYEKTTVSGVVWGRISKGWISLDYVKLDSGSNSGGSTTVIDTGTVTSTNSLRIRSGAGTSYAVVGTLSKGTRVEIYETKTVGSTKWGRIDKGWICLDYVKLDSAGSNESPVHTVTASSLRIRSGAGTSYSIVGFLSNGTKVTVLETKTVGGTVWGRIDKGWICMDYVK